MHTATRALAVASLLTLLPDAAAQTLSFQVRGGSMPGLVSMDLYPGSAPFYPCFVLTGVNAGPTPIALFDPADPRSLSVGPEIIGYSFFGLFGLDGHFRIGPLQVPLAAGLQDMRLVFQGISLPGSTTIIDAISPAHAIYFATANACRSRNIYCTDERAFGVALERADGRWMVVGGGRGGLLAQVAHATTEIYDELTDSFSYGPTMTTERSLHTATYLQDGRWLICGGVDRINDPQTSCEIYDPATDSFTAAAPMVTPRMGHTATLLVDGRVLVAGGLTSLATPTSAIFSTTNTTELYNPVTNAWTPGPNLRTPRAAQIAILRPDGRVLLCGGISYDFILPAARATTDLFDPSNNSIVAGPPMAQAHALTEATPIGGNRWLVAGGIGTMNLTSLGTPVAAAEIYDAVANTWSSAGSMAAARGNHRVWALGGGRFLHAGGADGAITAPNPLGTCEIYDAASNSWSAGPSLTIPRAGFAIFTTPAGQVQMFGGGTTGGSITTLTEWYYY